MKIVIFRAVKNRGMLHGRVFVMVLLERIFFHCSDGEFQICAKRHFCDFKQIFFHDIVDSQNIKHVLFSVSKLNVNCSNMSLKIVAFDFRMVCSCIGW